MTYMRGSLPVTHAYHGEITAKLLQQRDWIDEALSRSQLAIALRSGSPAHQSPSASQSTMATIGALLVRHGTRMQGTSSSGVNARVSS